jgi:hypothetical protein
MTGSFHASKATSSAALIPLIERGLHRSAGVVVDQLLRDLDRGRSRRRRRRVDLLLHLLDRLAKFADLAGLTSDEGVLLLEAGLCRGEPLLQILSRQRCCGCLCLRGDRSRLLGRLHGFGFERLIAGLHGHCALQLGDRDGCLLGVLLVAVGVAGDPRRLLGTTCRRSEVRASVCDVGHVTFRSGVRARPLRRRWPR